MKVKVAMLSAGLGNVKRGFEVSAINWFNAVNDSGVVEPRLFSGGKTPSATQIWNIPRDSGFTKLLRKFRLVHDGCRLEQLSFSLGFLIKLFTYKPDIIWSQETTLADMLIKYRRIFKFKYVIVFCDGAPIGYQFSRRFDFNIFLHENAFNDAISQGMNPKDGKTIPYFPMQPDNVITKSQAQAEMNLDPNKLNIICVAAWNTHHKRIDYLLKEAALIKSRPFTLLLCGQPEEEFEKLKALSAELNIECQWRTLDINRLKIAYRASDIFILPSLTEGLPAVLIEAGLNRLPVICHTHPAGKYIFGSDYFGLTDLSVKGNLANKVDLLVNKGDLQQVGNETEKLVEKRFDRVKLVEDFNSVMLSLKGPTRN